MASYDKSIEVGAPAGAVYRAWTRFGEFPRFVPGIERVTRLDEHHIRWFVSIGQVGREFTAEITEELPERRIAWRVVSGPAHAGSVSIEPLSERRSRLSLHLDYTPSGLIEQFGVATGAIGARLSTTLHRFARHVEHGGDPGPHNGTELASGPEAGLVFDRADLGGAPSSGHQR
jgi:uncharacterized membrane protein